MGSSIWWRVKPPIDSEFLVLVVCGRVANASRLCDFALVGAAWKKVRLEFERHGFVCTMTEDP